MKEAVKEGERYGFDIIVLGDPIGKKRKRDKGRSKRRPWYDLPKELSELRSWSDLPEELMESIMRKQYCADQLRFRAVCLNLQFMYPVPSAKQPPMLMAWHKNPYLSSVIFDPTNKRTFNITDDTHIKGENLQVCASKYGWLLIYDVYYKEIDKQQKECASFFFFNPFTSTKINLPVLESSGVHCATFSSPPTSSNCLVFNCYNLGQRVKISTCNVGDKRWISRGYKCDPPIHVSNPMKSVVLNDGSFHCVTGDGDLGTYNHSQRTWDQLELPAVMKDVNWKQPYLVSFGGELLLVLVMDTIPKEACAYWLDHTNKRWKLVRSLNDRSLFLGPTSFAVAESADTIKDGSDRVYNVRDEECEFYCLKSKTSYSWLSSYGSVKCKCPRIINHNYSCDAREKDSLFYCLSLKTETNMLWLSSYGPITCKCRARINHCCEKLWIEPPF
ncbi:F-box family protein [Thalictrum thalictroides]|uniref:F-box family protein n=1 Tax=Thalictrum thalictroides TaxID=46969 RepID=A0A7J6WEW4_THATH|nr:F-box family protein [Thalictrum thalictroides]